MQNDKRVAAPLFFEIKLIMASDFHTKKPVKEYQLKTFQGSRFESYFSESFHGSERGALAKIELLKGEREAFLNGLIADEFNDSDGYWIYLKEGYFFGYSGGSVAVENTKKEARLHLDYIYFDNNKTNS